MFFFKFCYFACVDSKGSVLPPACTDNRPWSHSGSSTLEENSRYSFPFITVHTMLHEKHVLASTNVHIAECSSVQVSTKQQN